MRARGSSHPQGRRWVSVLALTLLVCLTLGEGEGQEITSDVGQNVCTVKGKMYTNRDWYGYLVHKGFKREYAKIQYQITYPVKECCASLLIYYDDQVKQLRPSMSCEERLAVLPPDNNQVISLRANNDSTSGCSLYNKTGEAFYVCLGERVFRSSIPRTWFFAVSRCGSDRSEGPLNLNYIFNITGFFGECEEDPLSPGAGWSAYVQGLTGEEDSSSSTDVYRYLSISLGVFAGIAMILAAVFFGLWFINLRTASKGKGGSVTSSQATMTQDDIFYVNPSLSDRGEHPDYSQTNSGSENYYEVIPERRSYESINAGLSSASGTLMSANGGLHLRHIRGGAGAGAGGLNPHHPVHLGSLHHHHHHGHHPPQHHLHNGHLSLAQHRPHPLVGGGANIPLGHAPQPAQMNGVVPPGGHAKLPYVFEDYPPPPYQPPKMIGMKASTSGSGMGLGNPGAPNPAQNTVLAGHAHTLSLPTNQRQRPALCHHAYHSSMVPTSETLGNLGANNNNMTNSMILNNNNASGNNIVISSSGMLINTNNSLGGGVDNIQSSLAPPSNSGVGGVSSSLATFGGGANSSSSALVPPVGGINLTSLANHHLMGGASHAGPSASAASSTPLASLAAALNLNSASHVPAPAPSGQSETSA